MSRPPLEVGPCESCGQPVTMADLLAMAKAIAGIDPGEEHPEWQEVHEHEEPGGLLALTLREHTPERCRRARAGDPEPLGDDLDDLLDDEGEG